jgi:pyruvate dehydrogenase (quinone)
MRVAQPAELRDTVARALREPGPVVVDVSVDPAEIPAMPHIKLEQMWRFGVAKARELLGA